MIEVVDATHAHALNLAPRLRDADRREVMAVSGLGVYRALVQSIDGSDFAKAVEIDGRTEMIFGCGTSNIMSKVGAPWLLASDAIRTHYRIFLRESREWIRTMRRSYRHLVNAVDARNTVAIRWLQWLGFQMDEPVPMGYAGTPFITFRMDGFHV